MSSNCGGTAANIAPLLGAILIHDRDIVPIQELWEVSLRDEVALRAYVVVAGTSLGPRCGMCFLFHFFLLFAPNEYTPKLTQVLSYVSCWLSLLVQHGTGDVVLYTNYREKIVTKKH